jgi:hypothetical protein
MLGEIMENQSEKFNEIFIIRGRLGLINREIMLVKVGNEIVDFKIQKKNKNN